MNAAYMALASLTSLILVASGGVSGHLGSCWD
jgi:hypothetical protein